MLLWEKPGRAQKPFRYSGRTRDRTLDLPRVKGLRLSPSRSLRYFDHMAVATDHDHD
jgi:hypothetical protein